MAWRRGAISKLVLAVFLLTAFGCQPPPSADEMYDAVRQAMDQKEYSKALDLAESACEHYPDHMGLRFLKAVSLHSLKRRADAIEDYDQVLLMLQRTVGHKGHPLAADIHYFRAKALFEDGRWKAAVDGLINAAARFPVDDRLTNSLAWAFATVPEASLRRPQGAEELARRLCEKTQWAVPGYMDTLAAAQAAAGKHAEAADTLRRAIAVTKNEEQRIAYHKRLNLYQEGKSFVAGR